MYQFENSYFIYAFGIIPVFVLLFFIIKRWRKKTILIFGDLAVVNKMMPDISLAKRNWKFILFCFALMFLIVGLINPQAGTKLEEVKRTGADIVLCLDVSNSMNAEDLYPTRLEKAKQAISKLIDKLEGDRLGVIVFAGKAYVQLPITTDYAAAKLFLQTINTDMVPTQGTAVGSAIELAMESFGKDEGKNKAIIIITDGENHEDDAVKAAEKAAENNIMVCTIGMGSEKGGPIPIYRGTVREGFRKDKDGNTVITKLDEQSLQQIAYSGGGAYVRATNADSGLGSIMESINQLEKKQFETKMFSDYEDRFQWFVAIAFLLLVIELFISERKSKLLKRLNLYGDEKK